MSPNPPRRMFADLPWGKYRESMARNVNLNVYRSKVTIAIIRSTLRLNEVARRLVRDPHVGTVGVNCLRGVAPDAPVGGLKDSGVGYEGGTEGIANFGHWKYVTGIVV